MAKYPFILLAEDAPAEKVIIFLDDVPTERLGPKTFRKRVLRHGAWDHASAPNGVLTVDAAYCDGLVANFAAGVTDTVFVPFGHPGNEADGTLNNAGEVVGLEADAEGLWATISVDAAHADKIGSTVKGVSCGIMPAYTDREVGGAGDVGAVLAHVALTNEPYIKGLGDFEPVNLAQAGDGVLLTEHPEPETQPQGTPMTLEELMALAKDEHGIDIAELQTGAESLTELTTFLAAAAETTVEEEGAPAEDAEATVLAALADALVGAEVIQLAEGQEAPSQAQLVGAIVTMAQTGRDAQVKLAHTEAKAAVDAAIADGCVIPSKRDTFEALYLSDRETFASLTDTKLVNFSEMGAVGDLGDPTPASTADADEVQRLVGLAEEMSA